MRIFDNFEYLLPQGKEKKEGGKKKGKEIRVGNVDETNRRARGYSLLSDFRRYAVSPINVAGELLVRKMQIFSVVASSRSVNVSDDFERLDAFFYRLVGQMFFVLLVEGSWLFF